MSYTLTPETLDKRTIAAQAKAAALVENLEWMLEQKQSEYACLVAVGYARKPDGLKRQLIRIGRGDLIPCIFEYDHHINGRHPNGRPKR